MNDIVVATNLQREENETAEISSAIRLAGTSDKNFDEIEQFQQSALKVNLKVIQDDDMHSEQKYVEKDKKEQCVKVSKIHNIPLNRLRKAGFITPDIRKNRFSGEFRRLKRPLLKNMLLAEKDGSSLSNVFAITSSVAGEGKTFTAINLAMSLAMERDRTVLLVDADVAKSTLGKTFGVSLDQPGLVDLLDDQALDPADAILRTNVAGLTFLAGGKKNELTSELFSSSRMTKLSAELSTRYENRIILMDCPPVLQTNEAGLLADHAGHILYVVAEERTSHGSVMEGLKLIGRKNKVSMILNKSVSRVGNYGYQKYSYY